MRFLRLATSPKCTWINWRHVDRIRHSADQRHITKPWWVVAGLFSERLHGSCDSPKFHEKDEENIGHASCFCFRDSSLSRKHCIIFWVKWVIQGRSVTSAQVGGRNTTLVIHYMEQRVLLLSRYFPSPMCIQFSLEWAGILCPNQKFLAQLNYSNCDCATWGCGMTGRLWLEGTSVQHSAPMWITWRKHGLEGRGISKNSAISVVDYPLR